MNDGVIDLRSDTVTRPTSAMRAAMYHAEVGDDGYGEDPTINRLQEQAAELLQKEAALFFPTGRMANLAAILAHSAWGETVLLGDRSHSYCFEREAASVLGGRSLKAVMNAENGMLDLHALEQGFCTGSDDHFSRTGLLCIENTHNLCGGRVLSAVQVEQLANLAHLHGAAVHMDGARMFNAVTALADVSPAELVHPVDSVMFCLSKGLCAPAGSLLVGSCDFIVRAHSARSLLGGGMRQAGILAAAGIVALEQMRDRLSEDHANALQFATLLTPLWPSINLSIESIETNILVFTLQDNDGLLSEKMTARFVAQVKGHGVLVCQIGRGKIRAVFHYGVGAEDAATAADAICQALADLHMPVDGFSGDFSVKGVTNATGY